MWQPTKAPAAGTLASPALRFDFLGGGLVALAGHRAHPGRMADPALRSAAALRRRVMDGDIIGQPAAPGC